MVTSSRTRPSATVLMIANLIPLGGVLFFGWSLFAIIFLFWLENVVIGILNVVRMAKAEGPVAQGLSPRLNGKIYIPAMKGSLIAFFMMHYGIFTAVHGVFVFGMFGPIDVTLPALLLGILSLIISHVYSYKTNYIDNGEYKRVSAPGLFMHPYKRIVILHLTIIFGGILVEVLGAPVMALAVLVVLKIAVDLGIHMWEHDRLGKK